MCVIKTKSTTTPPPRPRLSPFLFFPSQATPRLPIFYLSPLHLWASSQARFLRTDTRELKQKRRRRLRKRLLKSKVALLQKRYRAYSISFNSSNVGNFFGGELDSKNFIKVQEKKTKVVVLCSRPPQNVKLGIFTSLSCSDCKEMYKKAWCTCKAVVLPN